MAWLFSASELHRRWPFAAVRQWLTPAIRLRQYRLYRENGRPVAFVTWARLSAEVETAYVRNPRGLRPEHWRSGDRIWLLDYVAPFGHAKAVAKDLKTNVFPDDVGRFLRQRPGDDTLRIMYVHGIRAIDKARDPAASPTVALR